jgi:hypothetical protein
MVARGGLGCVPRKKSTDQVVVRDASSKGTKRLVIVVMCTMVEAESTNLIQQLLTEFLGW